MHCLKRLTYFGHVTRMELDRSPNIGPTITWLYIEFEEKKDRRKYGLITFVMTVRASEFQYRKLLV